MNAQGQKTGGRQKGTPNKITAEIREFLASLVFDNMDLIRQDINDMTPEQRASFLPKILPYIVPKQKPKTEKDEQDIACDHVKSFLNLAQIVNSWEQDQQPSQNPAEAHLQNLPVPNTPASNCGLQPLEQPRPLNPAEAHYPVPSPEPEPSPTDEDKFQTSNFKLQNLCQLSPNPAEAPLNDNGQHPQSSDPSDSSSNSASSAQSTSSDKPVKRPTKQVQQRTPFYRNIKTRRTLKKRR